MNLAEFLSLIEFKTSYKPRASGKGFSAKCPCHDDKKIKFIRSRRKTQGKLLVYCHAGCSFGAICEELGVVPTQLFNQHLIIDKSNDIEHYYYHDENGNVLYRKSRTPSKQFYFEKMESGRWVKGINNLRRVLYNLPEVTTAINEGRLVHIVRRRKRC